jgi:hypothetical protein
MKALLSAGSALMLVAGPAAAETLQFDVFRNGKPFGSHVITLDQKGDTLLVNSRVLLEAKVGPLVAFKYRSVCSETWRGEELESLSCTTLKGGKTYRVVAKKSGAKLAVSVNGAPAATAPYVVPVSPWNMYSLNETHTLATDDGKVLPLAATDYGQEKITLAGKSTSARRIRYNSNLVVDSWYNASGHWLKAKFKARGQNIEYRARQGV